MRRRRTCSTIRAQEAVRDPEPSGEITIYELGGVRNEAHLSEDAKTGTLHVLAASPPSTLNGVGGAGGGSSARGGARVG